MRRRVRTRTKRRAGRATLDRARTGTAATSCAEGWVLRQGATLRPSPRNRSGLSPLPRITLIRARVVGVPHAPVAVALEAAFRRRALIRPLRVGDPHARAAALLEAAGRHRRALVRAGVVRVPHAVVALYLVAPFLRVAGRRARHDRERHEKYGYDETNKTAFSHIGISSRHSILTFTV